jgi:predicted permease
MGSFPAILIATLPVFLIIGIGAMFRGKGWLPDTADGPLMCLAINVFYPCLIAHHVIGNPALESVKTLAWSAGSGFGLLLVAFALGLLLARLLGLRSGAGLRTFAVSAGIQNYGFLPIPIIAALFSGDEANRMLGVLFLHNLGLEIAFWTVGVSLLRGSDHRSWKHLLNMPIFTIIISASITLLGWSAVVPKAFLETIAMLGEAAIPISLVLVGASLWTVNGETQWRGSWRIPIGACVLRFLMLPGVFLAAAVFLPVSMELKRNLVIQGAMPAGAFVVVLARHYGGHPATAGQIVIATSLVGLLAIPTLLAIGLRFVT